MVYTAAWFSVLIWTFFIILYYLVCGVFSFHYSLLIILFMSISNVVSWVFSAFRLISIYHWVHTMCFCVFLTSLRRIFSSYIHLSVNFMKSFFFVIIRYFPRLHFQSYPKGPPYPPPQTQTTPTPIFAQAFPSKGAKKILK